MMLATHPPQWKNPLRVALVTTHLPLRQVADAIQKDQLESIVRILHHSLQSTFGIARPMITVCGLNPHAGEGGLFGDEEARLLQPALEEVHARGFDVAGPCPPDTVFLDASEGKHDGVLALYHDQAFIPLKLMSKGRGVTLLAGLSYLRISPVHGTAFDIAGQGIADESNLIAALEMAAEWTRAPEAGTLS